MIATFRGQDKPASQQNLDEFVGGFTGIPAKTKVSWLPTGIYPIGASRHNTAEISDVADVAFEISISTIA